MGAHGGMGSKRSACLYIDKETLETANKIGLSISKVSEKALKEAVSRLSDPKDGTGLEVLWILRAEAGI